MLLHFYTYQSPQCFHNLVFQLHCHSPLSPILVPSWPQSEMSQVPANMAVVSIHAQSHKSKDHTDVAWQGDRQRRSSKSLARQQTVLPIPRAVCQRPHPWSKSFTYRPTATHPMTFRCSNCLLSKMTTKMLPRPIPPRQSSGLSTFPIFRTTRVYSNETLAPSLMRI